MGPVGDGRKPSVCDKFLEMQTHLLGVGHISVFISDITEPRVQTCAPLLGLDLVKHLPFFYVYVIYINM